MRFGGRAVRPVLVTICFALTVKLLSDPTNPLRVAVAGLVASWTA
jgi:hypothetical protein